MCKIGANDNVALENLIAHTNCPAQIKIIIVCDIRQPYRSHYLCNTTNLIDCIICATLVNFIDQSINVFMDHGSVNLFVLIICVTDRYRERLIFIPGIFVHIINNDTVYHIYNFLHTVCNYDRHNQELRTNEKTLCSRVQLLFN